MSPRTDMPSVLPAGIKKFMVEPGGIRNPGFAPHFCCFKFLHAKPWHSCGMQGSDSPNSFKIKNETPQGRFAFYLVEPGGIEPPSENHLSQLSPSAAGLLGFPSPNADRQAFGYGRC